MRLILKKKVNSALAKLQFGTSYPTSTILLQFTGFKIQITLQTCWFLWLQNRPHTLSFERNFSIWQYHQFSDKTNISFICYTESVSIELKQFKISNKYVHLICIKMQWFLIWYLFEKKNCSAEHITKVQ